METKTKEIIETAIEEKSKLVPEVMAEEVTALQDALNELDVNDRNSIIYFGSSAQEKLDEISNRMIDGVQNKDMGAAGAALNEMVASIRGFDMEKFNPNIKLAWYQKLFGVAKPIVKFLQEYEDVRDQIDMISNSLEKHKSYHDRHRFTR